MGSKMLVYEQAGELQWKELGSVFNHATYDPCDTKVRK